MSFASVPQGYHCVDNGLVCDYPQGRCACNASRGGPVLIDASASATWACQVPTTQGCPTPRPPLGSPCTQTGLFCDYGGCNIPGGTAEQCTGGRWQQAFAACPATASGG